MAALRVLIVGGYGTFGGRLARLLADRERLTLIVAGRSLAKAQAFCATLPTAQPAAFDRAGDVERQLREFAPDIVVDASGPFQSYGPDPYRLVRAALALGVRYLDLADSPDFVAGIARFDAQARARGVFALAGVSSFPALTAAVVRRMAQGMVRVDRVVGGIAPSPYVNVGLNVIRALAGYAGKPVATRADEPGSGRVSSARSRASSDAPCARTLELSRWPLASLASATRADEPGSGRVSGAHTLELSRWPLASLASATRHDGRKVYALIDTLRYTIAPPGRLPLYPIRFSLVDVPDLRVLPALWPSLRSVWIGAGRCRSSGTGLSTRSRGWCGCGLCRRCRRSRR